MIVDDEGGLHLHQSDIETYMLCPESLRRKTLAGMLGLSDNSDAAFVGTTVHNVIEHELAADEPYATLGEAQTYAAFAFANGFEDMVRKGTTYRRSSFQTDRKAMAAMKPLVQSWYESDERDTLMRMEPGVDYVVEHEFDIPFTVTPSGAKLYLAGRADLVILPFNRVWDWKTASSEYQAWEKQRWAVQPTQYLWAAATAGLIQPTNNEYTFEYKVLVRKAKPVKFQTVSVKRTVGSFAWLERLAQNMALMIETMGFENEWPLNDHSALCGPKWCPFWDTCKGQFINADWK